MSYLDLTFRLATILLTLGLGIAAYVIAKQQLEINKYRMKFDLFEKRFAIFMQMRNFASAIALGQEFDPGKLYRDTIERKFLFEPDSEVLTYFNEMYRRGNELNIILRDLQPAHMAGPDEGQRNALHEQELAQKTWFYEQSDAMFKVFSKDLSIETLK
jgi:hypothetical protein